MILKLNLKRYNIEISEFYFDENNGDVKGVYIGTIGTEFHFRNTHPPLLIPFRSFRIIITTEFGIFNWDFVLCP